MHVRRKRVRDHELFHHGLGVRGDYDSYGVHSKYDYLVLWCEWRNVLVELRDCVEFRPDLVLGSRIYVVFC